ncbi:hypothetical protein EP47_05020 [Legionella norrlandica]|uniref:Flagellar motor switch protein FliN-like C-terminal domain-containing protein n=1 Tax=Legionella norrlandica TaxID=1498499 RepID=A0A0A2SVG4_9GAMM|nr:FliM/FliN family flagellar motor switch protein [Legionella norrlandica]KGP63726.1 hypothetical protein EP47_05020 [Legionella norrlandica]
MFEQSEKPDQVNSSINEAGRDHPLDDIIISLRVELGSAKMKISELMGLGQNSIIQLAQKVTEPLIIYANDKPILRGQIISANGKYHIRIM